MNPEHFHDQNPTRTANNTPPDYLVRARELLNSIYERIEMITETLYTIAYAGGVPAKDSYDVLNHYKAEAMKQEYYVHKLYEQWQKSLPCTHPEHMVETIMEGSTTFTNGSVDSDQREMLHCKACHKIW